jgi:hypothetical protein
MHRKLVVVGSIVFLHMAEVLAFQSPRESDPPRFDDLVEPRTVIIVRQDGANIVFEFINGTNFGSTIKKNTPNDRITTVRVVNIFGEEVWKIEAPYGGQGAATITYQCRPKRI